MGKLGETSFGKLKLRELGETSNGKLKLRELGETSFGKLKLRGLGETSFGMLNISWVNVSSLNREFTALKDKSFFSFSLTNLLLTIRHIIINYP